MQVKFFRTRFFFVTPAQNFHSKIFEFDSNLLDAVKISAKI